MMKRFAFISRHNITKDQVALAAAQDIELVHVGDFDAFTVERGEFDDPETPFDGAVVVHPAAALRLQATGLSIGVFENQMRTKEGEKMLFMAKAFHIFD